MAQVIDRRWKKGLGGDRARTSYNGPKPWQARWRDPDGTQKSQTFARKVDAERFVAGISHRIHTGEYVDPDAGKATVEAWAEEWRSLQIQHRPSTREQVETYLRLHAYPMLGDRENRSIRPAHVQAWVTDRAQVLAPGSVELVYLCLEHLRLSR